MNNNFNDNEMRHSYFVVIPGIIFDDPRLSPNEKLLYGSIAALTEQRGYCWATNKHFSEKFGVSIRAISEWIGNLEKVGYLIINISKEEGNKREIILTEAHLLMSMSRGYRENSLEVRKKSSRAIDKNFYGSGKIIQNDGSTKPRKQSTATLNNKVNNKSILGKTSDEVFGRVVPTELEIQATEEKPPIPSLEEFLGERGVTWDYEGGDSDSVASKVYRDERGKKLSESKALEMYRRAYPPTPSVERRKAPRTRDHFDFDGWVESLEKSSNKVERIIAFVWKARGYRFDNYEQWRQRMGQDKKYAEQLTGYHKKYVQQTIDLCNEEETHLSYKWSMATLAKKIANVTLQ